MPADSEIGRVVAVDTAHVKIELNREIKGMVRNTYEDVQQVGRINSYVILPVAGQRLVAMVTRVALIEDTEVKADRKSVTFRGARRLMDATLVGTIKGTDFRQGVSTFPILDNAVHLADRTDLDAVFGSVEDSTTDDAHHERPRFCIPIGESTTISGRSVRIDPDAFFGKHAAILGSTGSGKSCTIATLLQSIHERQEVKRTTCIILDTNGEYREAFQKQSADDKWEDVGHRKIRYIPSGPDNESERLHIPYWFMNSEDFLRIFQASKGVQGPVLLEALRLARNNIENVSQVSILREDIMRELNYIHSLCSENSRGSIDARDRARGLRMHINNSDFVDTWKAIELSGELTKDDVENNLCSIEKIAYDPNDRTYPRVIPADASSLIRKTIETILDQIRSDFPREQRDLKCLTADVPAYFDKLQFRSHQIERVLHRKESGGAKAREFSGTMLLRIDRLLADPRFEFLFGPVDDVPPNPVHVLAAFIRDILGISAADGIQLSKDSDVPVSRYPFYDRQRYNAPHVDIVILDMSLLASEVLENVTALIGRIILEFLQHLGDHGDEHSRGSLPVVLVLEEAHNYIRQPRESGEESIARDVFERIAREGRKFGLSLVVASQRPSELSKTVLSQCNSFIVHRLQNPEDLRYFKQIVPSIYAPMLEQIPALAPQTALVLGECVPAPVLTHIRDADPIPRSRDPQFYKYWTADQPPSVDVESICSEWEGDSGSDSSTIDE